MTSHRVVCALLVSMLVASGSASAQPRARMQSATPLNAVTELERDLRTRLPAFERCRAERARLGERVEGRMTIAVTVRTNARVWPAIVTAHTTGNALLVGCVQSSFLSMRVRTAPARQSVFTFVLTFSGSSVALGEVAPFGPPESESAPQAEAPAPPPRAAERVISGNVNVGGGERTDTIASATPLESGEGLGRPRRTGEFDSSVVSAALRRASAAIRRCYENELRNDAWIGGKITVQFTILEVGTVQDAHASENTTGSPGLAACVVGAIGRLRFDPGPTGGSVQYRYPFVFTPYNGDPPPGRAAPASAPTYTDEFTP